MSLLSIFDVSGSAMAAQNVRLSTTASNIANAQSVAADPADTYRARHPVFASVLAAKQDGSEIPTAGVQVARITESSAPLQERYEPDHPYANKNGMVAYPNVSPVKEMADMISASRSFQLNVEVMTTARSLAEQLLTLGR